MEISLLKLASNRFSVQPLRLEAIISPRYAAKLPYQVAGDSDLGGPWQPLMKMMPDAVVPGKVVRREWKIEESIWKPRRKWADSRDFYDTDESMMRALENDLKMACSGDGLVRLVARHHTSPTAKGGGGVPSAADLMEQVKQALWTHHHMIYCIFDVYAALGVGDFTHMTANAYKQLLDDCNLIETAVDGLNAGLWDQLFVGINAVNTISEGDQYNHKKGLNRQEFVSFVVRAAVMRHVAFGEFTDVPAAIEQLLGTDMIPKIRQAVPSLAPANEFRAALCYQEETSDVFSRHIVSLRTIFDRYAYGAGQVNDKTNDRRLLGFDEWQELVDHLGLVDSQFAERQAGLCFILSRMRTTLESTTQGRAKVLQLSFEDFLEALVRVAASKALPTDEDCKKLQVADGGEFMLLMKTAESSVQANFLESHNVSPGRLQLQPIHRALEQLLVWILRLVSGRRSGPISDHKLTTQDVNAFHKRGGVSDGEALDASAASTRLSLTRDSSSSSREGSRDSAL